MKRKTPSPPLNFFGCAHVFNVHSKTGCDTLTLVKIADPRADSDCGVRVCNFARACDLLLGARVVRVSLPRPVVPLRRTEALLRRQRLPLPLSQPRRRSELPVGQDLERGRVRMRLPASSQLPPRRILQLRHLRVRNCLHTIHYTCSYLQNLKKQLCQNPVSCFVGWRPTV